MADALPAYYEFFVRGSMARSGLGDGWRCLFANDFDPMKAATCAVNWGSDHFVCGDHPIGMSRTKQPCRMKRTTIRLWKLIMALG